MILNKDRKSRSSICLDLGKVRRQDTERSSSRLRPESSISKFSEALNQKLSTVLSTRTVCGMKTLSNLSFHNTMQPPSFSKIIEKLEDITSKNSITQLHNPLKEDELYYFSLHKRAKLFFNIESLNRVSPLTIKLNQTGKITTFVSDSFSLPDQENHIKKFDSDTIIITDSNYRFKSKTLYFCMIASDACDLRLQFEFRKKESLSKSARIRNTKAKNDREINKIRNDIILKQQFTAHVNSILEGRRKKVLKLSGYKDFLKINKTFTHIKEKKEVIRSKSEERLVKEKQVNVRRTLLMNEKKSKMQELLIKQQMRFMVIENREAIKKQQALKEMRIKTWINWIYLVKTGINLLEKFREFKIEKIKKRNSIARIQKGYRRWNTRFFDNVSKELIHARNTLLMFQGIVKPFTKQSKIKFLKFLNESVSEIKPFLVFDGYLSKIVFIQKFFKEYLALRDFLMNKGVKIWMVQISRIIKKFINSSPNNKFLEQVLKIKDLKRNDYLREFVRERCRNRRVTWHNISQFLPSKGDVYKLIKMASIDS